MGPGARAGDVEMIAAGLRLETALAARTRTAVLRHPVAEAGIRALEATAGLAGVVPLIAPDAVNQKSHRVAPSFSPPSCDAVAEMSPGATETTNRSPRRWLRLDPC